jgi:hypothetical protein
LLKILSGTNITLAARRNETMVPRDSVLEAVAVIAARPTAEEHEAAQELVRRGFSELAAEVLITFVPLGLGRALITRLPADPPMTLAETALVRSGVREQDLEIRLAEVPQYVAARQLGEEAFHTGFISREEFEAASGWSSELNAVNNALASGRPLGGSRISPPVLLRLAEVPGFEEWYRSLRPGPTAFLLELFRRHDIDAVPADIWVVFPGRPMRANTEVVKERKHQLGWSVQLDVRIEIEPGRTIVESFAGLGETTDQALADAQHNFAVNSFHVILAAFFNPEDEQVTREEWIVGGSNRVVTIGNIGVRGTLPEGKSAAAWFEQFEEKLKSKPLGPGLHWVRLYYGQRQRKTMACEVLLDNEPWEELQAEMAAIDWPPGEAFYGVRLFLVIQDR